MTDLKIYQIGLGSFGRYGFEKLVEMHNYLEEVDIRLCGVAEKDFDRLEAAERFADRNGIELETFSTARELYEAAEKVDGEVMVYDASPSEMHSDHIHRSLENGFYHLTEKPPSLTRENHLQEKRLAKDSDVFYKVDFVERESPVVMKALELMEDESIETIQVFRESSTGAQKVLQPVERAGVKGGDILDKMVHEVYILDFIENIGKEIELNLQEAEASYFLPKDIGSEKLLTVEGGITDRIEDKTATGMTQAVFNASGTTLKLNSSWLGLSSEARNTASMIQEAVGENVLKTRYTEAGNNVFSDEEARFFIIEGSRSLAGDMLHKRLYDLETGEELETPDLLHDQLYRVIEKAVLAASGNEVDAEIDEKEVDVFMNALFDIRDKAVGNADDYLEELKQANKRLKHLVVEDEEVEEVPA